jgi:hypothetical protein
MEFQGATPNVGNLSLAPELMGTVSAASARSYGLEVAVSR